MKVLKVLFAILVVILLIISLTLVLAYQALHYSFLSYEESVKVLSDPSAQAETVEAFLEDNAISKDLDLPDQLVKNSIASFSATEVGDFVGSFIDNSLAYLFLKVDTVEPFDKTFITSFKENTITTAIDGIVENENYQLAIENLDKVDKETTKQGLAKSFDESKISYTDADLDAIVDSLYDGEPSKQKLKDALLEFIGNKIVIKFEPEPIVEKVLSTPRLINHKIDFILGQLMLIEVLLIIVLLLVVLYSGNGFFISMLFTLIFSIGFLQLFRIFDVGSLLGDAPTAGLMFHYYDHMAGLLIRNINYISLGALAFLIVLFIVNLIVNKLSTDDEEGRFRIARTVIALILIAAMSFVGFRTYVEVNEAKAAINSFNVEKELKDIDKLFQFKFDL